MKRIKEMIERFSFAQMTSNESGKTSGSGTMGVLICTVGTLCFFMGCIDAMFITGKIDILTQTVVFVGLGVALLGVRKVSGPDVVNTLHSETSEDIVIHSKDLQGLTDLDCKICKDGKCQCK